MYLNSDPHLTCPDEPGLSMLTANSSSYYPSQAQAARLTKVVEAAEAAEAEGGGGASEPLDLDSVEQGIGVEAAAQQLQRAAGERRGQPAGRGKGRGDWGVLCKGGAIEPGGLSDVAAAHPPPPSPRLPLASNLLRRPRPPVVPLPQWCKQPCLPPRPTPPYLTQPNLTPPRPTSPHTLHTTPPPQACPPCPRRCSTTWAWRRRPSSCSPPATRPASASPP